jgi:NHL repeat
MQLKSAAHYAAKTRRPLITLAIAALATIFLVTALPAATGDNIADAVLGQIDLAHNGLNNPGAGSLFTPGQMAVDVNAVHQHLYVVDAQNHRVLGWNDSAAFVSGQNADLEIGQPDFETTLCNSGTAGGDLAGLGADSLCGPGGVAVDAAGNLFVADSSNNRVLEYNQPFAQAKSVGFSANLVFGQGSAGTNFTGKACADSGPGNPAPSSTGMCQPIGVGLDSVGNLYVADASNNRVLEFNQPLAAPNVSTGAGDVVADLVFGQGSAGNNFSAHACVTSATGMCNPLSVAIDNSGNVFVGDDGDFRVLEFNQPLAPPNLATGVGDVVADRVFGQGSSATNFTAHQCFDGQASDPAPSADGICDSNAVAVDAGGDLFVTDNINSRVLEYLNPLAASGAMPGVPGHPGDVTADVVFGQGNNFALGSCGGGTGSGIAVSGGVLCLPNGVAINGIGDVFIADTSNSRVLRYNNPVSTPPVADVVLGQLDLIHNGVNGPTASALEVPQGIAIDSSLGRQRLYVADSGNNRVLGWTDGASFVNGDPADIVIGQPDANSTACNDGTALADVNKIGADSLCGPKDVAVDAQGHLYVSDSTNNRVLEYDDPFGAAAPAGLSANRVFGQSGVFTTVGCNLGSATLSASTLCGPEGLATDAAGNLFVSDQSNNRVLEYNLPLAPLNVATGAGDTVADRVFGQAGNFTTGACNAGNNTINGNTLCSPGGLAVDTSANLYVSDVNNSRVLEFNQPLAPLNLATGAGDTTADRVFGQGATGLGFTTNACASSTAPPPPSATGACRPAGLAVDLAGNLFVADSFNNRVLEYNQPLAPLNAQTGAGDVKADRVFGQGAAGTDFVASACADHGPGNPPPSATAMCRPGGVAIDSLGNLYVADESNNRVIRFDDPLGPFNGPTPTPTATPTGTAAATPSPTATATTTTTPTATTTATTVSTPTASPTVTATATASATATSTATPTQTATRTSTPTASATSTVTATPTSTASSTATATTTSSPTASATSSPTRTATPTATSSSTPTATPTATTSATATATATSTATSTATPTQTATRTSTATASATATATATASATATATSTPSPTTSPVKTPVQSPTPTATPTATPTSTPTATPTPTPVAALGVSPQSLKLGNVVFGGGKTSKPKRVVITNTSKTAPVTFASIVASGDFSDASGCGSTIAPRKKCNVSVKFLPTALGARSGTLTITSNATNSPIAVPLSGTGTTKKKK